MFTLQLLAAPESAGGGNASVPVDYICMQGCTPKPLRLVLGTNWTAKGQRRIRFEPFPASNGFDCNDAGIVIMIAGQENARFRRSWIFNGTFGIARLLIFMVPLFLASFEVWVWAWMKRDWRIRCANFFLRIESSRKLFWLYCDFRRFSLRDWWNLSKSNFVIIVIIFNARFRPGLRGKVISVESNDSLIIFWD